MVKLLGGILAFVAITVVIAMLPGVQQGINKSNLEGAAAWWESQGYVAYADPY